MRLISWNVQMGGGKRISAQASSLGQRNPDVVALQEVRAKSASLYREALGSLGLIHVQDTFTLVDNPSALIGGRKDGLLIASRWPFTTLPPTDFPIPYHERVLSVVLEGPLGPIEFHNTHLPNGCNHEWIKVETFEGIYERLARHATLPRLLCGDFNSPKVEIAKGIILTAGQYLDSTRHHRRGDYKPKADQPLGRWAKAEHSVIEGLARYDLQDVFRWLHGYGKQEFSLEIVHSGVSFPYRFDHVFASKALNPVACQYLHELRTNGLSDHSPIEADFEPHPI